ncbi:MAG TPA: ATP-dependent DNA helicase [Actinomycetota bacterium]|nr:ATP-dependent DNA helicase [Actinomycetota bacterium]
MTGFTESMQDVLELTEGRLLVSGPPGTGKTRALVERFALLVEGGADPERVLLIVLNRRAARDARERLIRRLARSLPHVQVYTAHSFAYRVLGRRFAELDYPEAPQVLSAAEQYATVRELLLNERPEEWPVFGHLLGVRGFAREVSDFVLRAQERLFDPISLAEELVRIGRSDASEVVGFFTRYLDVMTAANRVDFAGLLHQAVALLQNSIGEEDRAEHVLIDDYQDVTPAAEAIVQALAQGARSTVVAADPGGHVFAYRGGSLEPLRRIDKILAPGRVVLDDVTSRLEPAALGVLDDPDAGASDTPASRLESRCYVHPGEEADAIAHELVRARVDDDVAWERMAVVVRRYGEYLTALRHALKRHGVPHVVLGEASAVAAEPANRPVIALLRYALRPERREDLLEPVLSSAAGGLDPHGLRRLRREARRRGVSLQELVLGGTDPMALPDDLREAVARFRTLVEGVEERADRPPDEVFFWVWSNLPYAQALVESESHRDLDALAALGDIIARYTERRGEGASMAEYLETLEAAEFGPDPWVLPEERHPRAVQVVSAHRAHGLEFDLVCVAGCVEGEFPAPRRAAALVDLDQLIAPRTQAERLRDSLAEERRLFRLAVTRSRGRTILFASESPSGTNPRTPSRYAKRLGLEWSRPVEHTGVASSIRSIEAELRRVLADDRAPAADRLAALAALPRTDADPKSWWGARDWTEPGVPLYEEEIRTSYSRLSNMEDCALKYLYEVEMGLDPEQSYQMWLGSVIHEIIDRVQREEVPREPEPVLALLAEMWDPNRFPSAAVEHRRRLDAEEMLRRWMTGEQAKVEHSEVSFAYPLGDAIIRGKIDAIFRNENRRLRLVDYKTGRWAPTKEEAERNLQLAAYYLAMIRDPELSRLGKTGLLQLSFLGALRGEDGFARVIVTPREGYGEWAEATITELVGRIRAESFAPNPAADCRWCDFKPICPLWPQGQEAIR